MFGGRVPDEFAVKVFRIFDADGGGSLSAHEFADAVDSLLNGS
jgi:Ca2+-binding EF-hand superfamily protein|tara:strand:- start:301 stop:429 length:129 start_codon:yes stop_codon:yes gene_type:complete